MAAVGSHGQQHSRLKKCCRPGEAQREQQMQWALQDQQAELKYLNPQKHSGYRSCTEHFETSGG